MTGFRLLHRHPAHGYTTNPAMAAPGEPEALTADQLDDVTSRSRRRHHAAQIAAWKQERADLEHRIERLHAHGPELATTLRAMQRQLDRLDSLLSRRYSPS